MISMFTTAAVSLVVAGALAFWYFNKSESDSKVQEQFNSQVEEDDTPAEV